MAYRITATTDSDKTLLDMIRDIAWKERKDVSEVMREAFLIRKWGKDKADEIIAASRPN
jgi:hypothetical protein